MPIKLSTEPYNPSPVRRWAQIGFAIFFCLFTAGVIFGFAALKPVLIAEGVYSDLCKPGERQRDERGAWRVCVDQDTRMNFLFAFGSVLANLVTLPVGFCLDKLGPRYTSIIGAILFGIGNFLFGLGYRNDYIDTYLIGFLILGVGGPLIFLSSYHLSNAFPQYSGVVLAAVTGAFDASSIPYVFYRMAFDATGGKLTIRIFFWCYLILPVLVIIEQLTIAPPETYQRLAGNEPVPPDIEDHVTPPSAPAPQRRTSHARSEVDDEMSESAMAAFSSFSRINYGDAHNDDEVMVAELAVKDPMTGVMYGQSAKEQIFSHWWVILTFFVCIHMTRINFYVMTVDTQLAAYTGDPVLGAKLTTAFSILLPLAGIVGVPFVGLLLDHRPLFDVVCVLGVVGFAFGTLTMTHAGWSQLLGIAFFCLFRPLMYTSVSDSFAKIFGFVHFGTVYGLTMTISGCVGLVSAPLDIFVKTRLSGSFLPVGTTLVTFGVIIAATFATAIWRQTRRGAVALQ